MTTLNQLTRIATFAPIHRFLEMKRSTSRGQDTYGYPIIKLIDSNTGQTYKCMGGGYDMLGTNLGQFIKQLTVDHPEVLNALAKITYKKAKLGETYYGLTIRGEVKNKDHSLNPTKVKKAILAQQFYLDGACGDNCMIRIAYDMGLLIKSEYSRSTRKGCYDKFLGYSVSLDAKGLITKEFAKTMCGV